MRDLAYAVPWSGTTTFRIRIEDAHQFTEVFNTRPGSGRANDRPYQGIVEDCKTMRCSTGSLATLRNLPTSALIVLLTPFLTPAKASEPSSKAEATDPFEAFGRELSKSHKRVRHVPYVPEAGMTNTHSVFLSQAGAVIVVTCESATAGAESMKQQEAFARKVAGARQALPGLENVPFILMRFEEKDGDVGLEEYENAFRASTLDDHSVDRAAQLMFKHTI